MPPSVTIFADSEVGIHCTQWLIENHKKDIKTIVTTSRNEIYSLAEANGITAHIFRDEPSYLKFVETKDYQYDLGILLWWPKIISASVIAKAKFGFINTHPSFLPHNRGKHYNFWALVEQCPFGVSLHQVEEGIDCGDLVAQKIIGYTWEDTGKTLYAKATEGIEKLFVETYPALRTLSFTHKPQDLSQGSFHFSSELDAASKINLDEPTTPRRLLNLLRARTFEGKPGCSFNDGGKEYEVTVNITEKHNE
jgi:methionyl-tRNA formyltransferase